MHYTTEQRAKSKLKLSWKIKKVCHICIIYMLSCLLRIYTIHKYIYIYIRNILYIYAH